MPSMASWFRLGISSTTSNSSYHLHFEFILNSNNNNNNKNHFRIFLIQFSFVLSQFSKISVYLITHRDYSRRIYHLVSSAEIKVSWKELIDCGRWIIVNKLPLNGVVWYPGGSMKSNRLQHNICCILFHWIPAILIDCLLFCLRYPPV